MKQIQTTRKRRSAFTLIELLIVVAIIGILATIAGPEAFKALEKARAQKSVTQVKGIVDQMKTWALDNDGYFPWRGASEDGEKGEDFGTSVDAFQFLLDENLVDTEATFYNKTEDADRKDEPNEDYELTPEEVVYGYTTGLSTSKYSNTPIVFDGMMSNDGTFDDRHPWLAMKKAVVGTVGQGVMLLDLTSDQEGATAMGAGGNIENVFDEREGKGEGGWLDADPDDVLLPE